MNKNNIHITSHYKSVSELLILRTTAQDYFPYLPGGRLVKNLPVNAGNVSLIPGLGIFHMLWSN